MHKQLQNAHDVIGPEAKKLVYAPPNGCVLHLENVRFYKEDEKNGQDFANKLASYTNLVTLITQSFLCQLS